MSALRKCVVSLSLLSTNHVRHPHSCIAQRTYKRWYAPTLKQMKLRKELMKPEPPQHRSSYLEWNYSAERFAFGKRLNEEFSDDLLVRAFTHRSYILQEEDRRREVGMENPNLELEDNRALVETGEQFMSRYIDQYVRSLLPRFPEEGIRAVHDFLMSEEVLSHISCNIGTTDLILCSDFPVEKPTLAATLKAVVGALLESSGHERAGAFVRDLVMTHLAGKDVNDIWQPQDPIAVLQDILAREGKGIPEPRLIGEAGRNTILAAYQVGLYLDKKLIGKGSGETVSTATEMAALDVLRRLFGTTDSMAAFSFTLNVDTESNTKPSQHVSIDNWSLKNVVQC